MGKEMATTRHTLTSGGYGRWEDTDGGMVFVDYQTGQIVENLSEQALKLHGSRFDLVTDDAADDSTAADVVGDVLQSRVVDVRPLIQSIDDRPTLHRILDQDKRPKVQGLARSRLKDLPKE
jgi:hypothetical protein